jgi:hypothetical protein
MDAEAFVQGKFAVENNETGLRFQTNDVFAKLVDLGEKVSVTIAENDLGTFSTRLRSEPGPTGSMLVGGAFELKQRDPFQIKSFEQDIVSCISIPILTLHVNDGHIQAPNVRIGGVYVVVDGVRDMTIRPGKAYVALGVEGTYDRFSMVAPQVHAQLDMDLSLRIEKFDQPLFPLYEWAFKTNPNDVYSGLRFHVFDMKKRTNAEFQVLIGPVPVGVYADESSPGKLGYQIPADPHVSGITVLPPPDLGDPNTRTFVFSMMDPGRVVNGQMQYLDGESAQLLDIAVSRAFSPFPAEGESGGGPC